jgi:hypothetical protein
MGVTGKYYDGASMRGETPRLIWKSIVPERVNAKDQGEAEPWRYADALAREVARFFGQCDGDHDDADAQPWDELLASIAVRREHEDVNIEVDEPEHVDQEIVSPQLRDGGPPWRELENIIIDIKSWVMGTGGTGVRREVSTTARRQDAIGDRINGIRERIKEGRTVKERDDQHKAEERWRAWITEGADAGARNAHAAVRMPSQWNPTVAEDSQQIYTADPMKLLEAQRREYIAEWRASESPIARNGWKAMQPLPAMTAEHLRATAREVAERTTQTYDGFHPRHISMLCDQALAALSTLYQAMEAAALWPTQVSLVTMPALPKPLGGFRLIGIFAAVYRVWSKARRPEAQAWEDDHDRPYFACGADRGAVDVVWRQAMRAEVAVAADQQAAAITSDLKKFYEALDHGLLLERAARHGFPMQIVRLAVAAYRGPRVIRMGSFIARELFADRGVIAGCSLATTLTKV